MFSHRLTRLLFLATSFSVLIACGDARDESTALESDAGPLAAINEANLRTHLEWLADDAREGREAGTPGHEAAAKYVPRPRA